MTNYRTGLSLVFGTALISGVSIFLNAFGVKGIDPILFAGLKNISVGLIAIGGIIALRNMASVRALSKKNWLMLGFIGLIGGSVPFMLFFNGLVLTEAGRAGFIHKLMFAFVSLFAVTFLKERLSKFMWLGLSVLLLGQIMVLQLVPTSFSRGDAFILAATILWSVEIIVAKKALTSISPAIVSAGRMFFGGVIIWIVLLATGKASGVLTLSFAQWQWVLVTTVLLAGYVLTFYHGLARVPAHTATAILTLGAPITLLLQALFLEGTVTVTQIAGSLLMTAALVWIARRTKRFEAHEQLLARDHQ